MDRITFDYSYALTTLKAGSLVEIPISTTTTQKVSAISLILRYLNEYIEVQEVTKNFENGNFMVGYPFPNEVRIGWFSSTPIEAFTITIKCKVLKDVPIGQQVMFTLYEADPINPLNELADENGIPIEGVVLAATSLAQKALVAERKEAQGYIGTPVVKCCSNCNERALNRCSIGGFVIAKKGICKLYKP